MDLVTFDLTLAGHGWAEVALGTEAKTLEWSASDLVDSILDLARAAIDLATGTIDHATIEFFLEPSAYRLDLQRAIGAELSFTVEFAGKENLKNLYGLAGPMEYAPVLSGETTVPWFCRRMHAILADIDAMCTDEEYADQYWTMGSFPRQEYERLGLIVKGLGPA